MSVMLSHCRWCYLSTTINDVTVRKLSIALDDDVAAAAAASAEKHGQSLSAWLNDAAAQALAVEDGLAAVAEWETEHGALTDDELAAADAVLDRAGGRAPRRIA
jgi:predicted transcriptional regulator